MKKALIITGGSKGIGLATSELFSANAYHVINLSRTHSPATEVTQICVDLGKPGWLQSTQEELLQSLEGIDQLCVVHSAALMLKDSVQTTNAVDLTRALLVNVVAAAELNALLIPRMATGSSILYLGSTLAEMAVANSCSYVVSKHALLGLMRATCQDLMGSGIHTACICPGFTDTEMLRDHLGQDTEIIKSIAQSNAFGRLITPEEIARTLLFCAREPVLNGSVIHANLGQKQS